MFGGSLATVATARAALAAGDLAAAEEAVAQFRRRAFPGGPLSHDRATIALELAAAYFTRDNLAPAEVWALRTLQDGPLPDAFLLLGEIAWRKGDHESALEWTAIGCRGQPEAIATLRLFQSTVSVRRPTYVEPGDRHVLVLMTAPRVSPTLPATITSLQAAGLASWRGPRILIADGCKPDLATTGLQVCIATPESVGQVEALRLAVKSAIALKPDRITLLEDDVALSRNALMYIDRVRLDDDLCLVAWHYGGITPWRSAPRPHLAVMSMDKFSRLQGVTLSRATAQAFLETSLPWPDRHGGDILLARVCASGMYGAHFPNLVQHVGGEVSAVGNRDARLSDTFFGSEADALTLAPFLTPAASRP